MRASPQMPDRMEKSSKPSTIVRIGPYYINAKPRAKGGYSYVYQGWHESDEKIELAFKLLLLHDRKGLLSRSQTRDIDNMVSLMDAMNRRPGADSDHPDLYIDFPFLPLLDIVDVSSAYKPSAHYLKEYESEKDAELSLLLVFPLCAFDLKTYLKRGSLFSAKEDTVLSIAYRILRAVGIMHSLGWSHRDLKPENMLISKDGQLLLCDFGMARCEVTFMRRFGVQYNYDYTNNSYTNTKMLIREYDERYAIAYDTFNADDACTIDETHDNAACIGADGSGIVSRKLLPPAGATLICGTIWWRSPEQSFKKHANYSGFAGDSWSLGCILIQLIFDYPAFHSKDRDESTGSGEVLAYVNQLRPLAENSVFLEAIAETSDTTRPFIEAFKVVTTKLNKPHITELRQLISLPDTEIESLLSDGADTTDVTSGNAPVDSGREDTADDGLQQPLPKHNAATAMVKKPVSPQLKHLALLNRHALRSPHKNCESLYSTSKYDLKQACFLMLVLRFAPVAKVISMMEEPDIALEELFILLDLNHTSIRFYSAYADLVFRLMDPNPLTRMMVTEALTHPIFNSTRGSLFYKFDVDSFKAAKMDDNRTTNNLLHKINIILNRKVDFSKDYLPVLLNEISHRTLDRLVFTYCQST